MLRRTPVVIAALLALSPALSRAQSSPLDTKKKGMKDATAKDSVAKSTPAPSSGGVRFVSDSPQLEFHVKTSETRFLATGYSARTGTVYVGGTISQYSRLCVAPCSAPLAAGRYTFALTSPDGGAIAREPVELTASSTVRGTFTSYRSTRIAGLVVLAGGVTLGTILLVDGSPTPGAILAIGSAGVGTWLALTSDEATVVVVPTATASGWKPPGKEGAAFALAPVTAPAGLTLHATF